MKQLTLPHDEYKIKAASCILTRRPVQQFDTCKTNESWCLTKPNILGAATIDFLFLKSISKKYITFRYFIGDSIQIFRLKPEHLIPVENETLNTEL